MADDSGFPGYPVKIPKLHVINETVNWTKPEDIPFPVSILKVFVIPPKHCDVPVLPMKVGNGDERLLFSLCSKCSRKYPIGLVKEDYECKHSDKVLF
jgi:hypothetical protein